MLLQCMQKTQEKQAVLIHGTADIQKGDQSWFTLTSLAKTEMKWLSTMLQIASNRSSKTDADQNVEKDAVDEKVVH